MYKFANIPSLPGMCHGLVAKIDFKVLSNSSMQISMNFSPKGSNELICTFKKLKTRI